MTIYKITASQLSFLGFSGGVGSLLLGGAVYFYKRLGDLQKSATADAELVYQTSVAMWFMGALAFTCYVVFGGIIMTVKWSHGKRGWKLIF